MTTPDNELVSRLEPCPFCGGEAEHLVQRWGAPPRSYHSVKCGRCGLWQDSRSDDGAEAATIWNTRAPDARIEALVAEKRSLQRMVELFPEAHDTLTRQEMRDAKGNWRSLIDQQNNALAALRAALKDTTDDRLGEEA